MFRSIRTHLNPASLLAMVALFVALGGISYAAATIDGSSLVNKSVAGKKLKNGAVTNVKVKQGSLSADRLSSSARDSLKGAQGPAGPAGQQGQQGIPGQQGEQGVQGPAGTALAYAQVSDSTPSLVAARTHGITAVSRPAVGTYCLAADDTVRAQAFTAGGSPLRPTVATVEYGNTVTQTDSLIVQTRGANNDCPNNTFEVHTYRNGAASNTVSFSLIVP